MSVSSTNPGGPFHTLFLGSFHQVLGLSVERHLGPLCA